MNFKKSFPLFLLLLPLILDAQAPCNDKLKSSLQEVDSLFQYSVKGLYPHIKENRALADSCGSQYLQGWAVEAEAYYFYALSELPRAIELYKQAIEIYEDSAAIYFCLGMLGDCYSNLGLSEKAIDHYLEVLPYYQSNNDTYSLASTYLNIGLIHFDQESLALADTYYSKALRLASPKHYPFILADIFVNKGDLVLEQGDTLQAEKYYTKSLDLSAKHKYHMGWAQALMGISHIQYLRSKVDSGIQTSKQAVAHAMQSDDAFVIGTSNMWLADFYMEEGDTAKARQTLQLAEAYIAKTNALHLKNNLVYARAELAAERGKFDKAYELMSEAYDLNDSLRSQNAEQVLTQYELEKQELENLKQLNENKLRQGQLRQKNYIIAGAIILIALLLILAWTAWRNYRKSQRLNKTKDYIISVIGHDLRTPVFQIKELLTLAEQNTSARDEALAMAKESSSSLVKSFDNLVHWAKSQLAGVSVRKESIMLDQLIGETIEFFSVSLEKKRLTVEQQNIEGQSVGFDPTHLKIILRNLLSNAIKFSYEGGKIQIHFTEKDGKPQLRITDQGKGMPADLIKRIKNHNLAFSTPGTSEEEGTGMGLSLVKKFLNANGADLKISSERGKGSNFTIIFG